jgi:hypothetical protein
MNTQDYIDKLGVVPSECSCNRCQLMCTAPCCGSVEDFEKLIDAGYSNRIMLDDLPSVPDVGDFLKPALKGYEGKKAPWHTRSEEGCTFWKEGKCELHDLGLKPIQGRIAMHGNPKYSFDQYAQISKEDWGSERGLALIQKWKDIVKEES